LAIALALESAGFVDNNWLDNNGHPGTESLRLTERFHRRDFGHIDLQMTIDDPKAYTKPWTVTVPLQCDARRRAHRVRLRRKRKGSPASSR
jgi:hypothetical protein